MVHPLTARMAAELVFHEAIVTQAYLDGADVWTWGIGVTRASGQDPLRYKDAPAGVDTCLQVFIDLVRTVYFPPVMDAFEGAELSQAQTAAALSFHYNTGAIGTASWVDEVRKGDMARAQKRMMDWVKPDSVRLRRERENALFFKGQWASDGTALVIPVNTHTHRPDVNRAKRVDIMAPLMQLLDNAVALKPS